MLNWSVRTKENAAADAFGLNFYSQSAKQACFSATGSSFPKGVQVTLEKKWLIAVQQVATSTGTAVAAFSASIRATKICWGLPPNIFRFICSLMGVFYCS